MQTVILANETDFDGWRAEARRLCGQGVAPEMISWQVEGKGGDLFASVSEASPAQGPVREISVPKSFPGIARAVICHRDEERFDRLYRILWRLQTEKNLIERKADPDIVWLRSREKAIRRDVHKMHAFVRFRKAGDAPDGRENFVSWFEPTHRIEEIGTPFFKRRFANMNWAIVTPEKTARWDGKTLSFGPGGSKRDVPSEDVMEEGWKTYFASIFNPARVKISAMTSEMPKKYWKNLPEAELIPELLEQAETRARQMVEESITEANRLADVVATRREVQPQTVEIRSLEDLKVAASKCERCPLYCDASKTVMGEGPSGARLMIVGEQPGDQEDIAGRPFVGPAGQLLNEALLKAGIDRRRTYVTNAVKHFKFMTRGKRRIHQSPTVREIDVCGQWLSEERRLVRPNVIIALGASAARGILGQSVTLKDWRGEIHELADGTKLVVTVHPSYLLRLPDVQRAEAERRLFVSELALAATALQPVKPVDKFTHQAELTFD